MSINDRKTNFMIFIGWLTLLTVMFTWSIYCYIHANYQSIAAIQPEEITTMKIEPDPTVIMSTEVTQPQSTIETVPEETSLPIETDPVETTSPIVVEPSETVPMETQTPTISEYEIAHVIWDFLKNNGYSDVVSAGILGNIMAECGGSSLSLQPEIYGGNYYGICQWNSYYFPDVQGQNLEYQLNYLHNTISSQFGDNLDRFLSCTNVRSAAKQFAIWYERCAKWSYELRANNAEYAYNYFVKG